MGLQRRLAVAMTTVAVVGASAGVSGAEVDISGFAEGAIGVRTSVIPDPYQSTSSVERGRGDYTLKETRLQLRGDSYGDFAEMHFRVDVTGDQVEGTESAELREAFIKFTTFGDHLDVRIGRQPTTWGTGDLLFINDQFAKDWESFFSGRDLEYLKVPSDVIRLGVFGLPFNVDIVVSPEYDQDNLPFQPSGLRFVMPGPGFSSYPETPGGADLSNSEVSVALSKSFGAWVVTAYGHRGYWNTPNGFRYGAPNSEGLYSVSLPLGPGAYTRLNAWGASLRGPWMGGVASLEGGWLDSRAGRDELRPEGYGYVGREPEFRGLAGFERTNSGWTLGAQFYAEMREDPDRWEEKIAQMQGDLDPGDDTHTILTGKVERTLLYETLRLSAFVFGSPSAEDLYARLSATYELTNEVRVVLGANVFEGDSPGTLFGVQDKNDNVYLRVRYLF